VKLAEPAEQAIGAPLRRGRTRPQDPEDGTILIISIIKFCVSKLFIMLKYVLHKASTRDDPYYLGVWQPTR
jgi:hypothetical protein